MIGKVVFIGLIAAIIGYLSSFPIEINEKDMLAILAIGDENIVQVKSIQVPKPKSGQVLIKVHYAPVNPSDVYYAAGQSSYMEKKPFPYQVGFEGSGIVVGSGGGVLASLYAKLGLSVGFASKHDTSSWSQYVTVPAAEVLPLPGSVSLLQGCSSFVNPLTTVAMLEIAKKENHKAIVHTAANSALGLMLIRASKKYNVTIIGVVRGEHNEKALLEAGHPAELIIRSDLKDSFKTKLKQVIQQNDATLAFDAVGGELASDIYHAMPKVSKTYTYGNLSGQGKPKDLTSGTKEKPYGYFLVNDWIEETPTNLLKAIYALYNMLADELSTSFSKTIPISDSKQVEKYIRNYAKHQKGGKVAISFAE